MHCALHFRTSNRALVCAFASFTISLFSIPPNAALETFRGCLHRGGGPQIGEVTCGGSPHLSCKGDQIKMRDGLPHLSGLPQLPRVLHLHVNRPLDSRSRFQLWPPKPKSNRHLNRDIWFQIQEKVLVVLFGCGDPPPPSLKYVMEIPAGISYTPGMYHNPLPIFLSGRKTKQGSISLIT